jgi:translocation and assembly module TamA
LSHQDFPAYKGPLTRYFGGLERPLAKQWKLLAGIALEFSNLDDLQGARDFYLFGLEVTGKRDTSNNRFNPSEGTRLQLSLRPYSGQGDDNVSFLISEITGTGYYAPFGGTRFILAGRTKFGTIVGENTDRLPANKRFYSGGSSIRGYKFQFVGPMGPGETPLGGRSQLELGGELRAKVTETIGGVIFVEGGQVYDDELPEFDGDLQWAAGFGIRYFTMIGPVRLDFGFPINPRDSDDSFQFYISIGQAF